MSTPVCTNLQQSLAWCEGTPEYAGIRRRLYYINKNSIVAWPTLPADEKGRVTAATYQGSFTLAEDATWKFIDIIPDKSQLTSEPQGEYPSQSQLNKLVAVHPGIGPDASAAAAYLNNSDNVFIVQDAKGRYRVVGSEPWQATTTVNQDNGQGSAGAASTTINVDAPDKVPAPFYEGEIVTDDGTINETTSAPSGPTYPPPNPNDGE